MPRSGRNDATVQISRPPRLGRTKCLRKSVNNEFIGEVLEQLTKYVRLSLTEGHCLIFDEHRRGYSSRNRNSQGAGL
jgi:hypothetical protein